jgi:hypothetical protein
MFIAGQPRAFNSDAPERLPNGFLTSVLARELTPCSFRENKQRFQVFGFARDCQHRSTGPHRMHFSSVAVGPLYWDGSLSAIWTPARFFPANFHTLNVAQDFKLPSYHWIMSLTGQRNGFLSCAFFPCSLPRTFSPAVFPPMRWTYVRAGRCADRITYGPMLRSSDSSTSFHQAHPRSVLHRHCGVPGRQFRSKPDRSAYHLRRCWIEEGSCAS